MSALSPWSADLLAVCQQSALMIWRLAPYVLIGAALGAWLVRRPNRWLSFLTGGHRPVIMVVLACLTGTLSPLCTLGTIPVLVSLLRHGMSAGAAVAFLGGSSMTNPQLLVLTVGTVGFPLAASQWLASVGVGVSLGLLVLGLERFHVVVCSPGTRHPPSHAHASRPSLVAEFIVQLDHVALYMVAGVVVAALINVYLPAGWLAGLADRSGALAVLGGALLSGPFYVCGGGALPAMAALMDKGIPPGAVLAFFIAGPATRIQALAALAAVVRPWFLVLYVAVVLAWAMATGLAANGVLATAS